MSGATDGDELARVRAEVSRQLESGAVPAALDRLALAIGGELGHALVPDYLALALRSGSASALEQLVAASRGSWQSLELSRAREIVNALARSGSFESAFELTGEGSLASDREAACLRGACALRLNRADDALAAADVAIASLLHDGVSVADFIRRSLRHDGVEGLLRDERSAIANIPELQEPLALRWEALRRSGRRDEAREMRSVCIQHFPERASVWSTAGNQALDEGEPDRAEGYFDRCLRLDPNWPAALAGKAIVLETRKDWPGALQLRARVVDATHALAGDDPASLHRIVRLAAALARVDRWAEAEPLFWRCLALGALEKLPAERPLFVRVFSRELFSPAIIASLQARGAPLDANTDEAVKLALVEASAFGRLYARIQNDGALGTSDKLGLLGMCAWLAGDPLRAYALLDEAEREDAPDLALQYLLASSAAAVGSGDRASIEAYALREAEAVLERDARGETVSETDRLYARLIVARSGRGEAPPALETARVPPGETRDAQLRRLVAFRASARAAGRSSYDVARASAAAVDALAGGPAERPG